MARSGEVDPDKTKKIKTIPKCGPRYQPDRFRFYLEQALENAPPGFVQLSIEQILQYDEVRAA